MAPARILIIEDDARLLRILTVHFQSRGMECVNATDGKTGFSLASAGGFDLILADLMLPGGMDGLAVARELARVAQHAPVIVMTGQGTADNAVRALRQGAADFLTKPFQLKELDAAVDRALARNAGGRDTAPRAKPPSQGSQPAVHQSLSAFLAVLERVPGAEADAGDSQETQALMGYVEALVKSLSLPPEDAQRLRWAARLSTVSPDVLDELASVGEVAAIARGRAARWDRRDAMPGTPAEPLTLVGRCLAVAHAAAEATDSTSTMPATDVRIALRHGAGTRLDPAIVERFVALPDDVLAAPTRRPAREVASPARAAPVLPA